MKEYTISVYNVNTLETIDTFEAEFENVGDLCEFMESELHNYDDRYMNLNYRYTTLDYKKNNQNTPKHYQGTIQPIDLTKALKEKKPIISSTPKHYQGTIQPIDLINAQNLNFNLGNVVKYVCRAGKKQGENVLSDLEKAQNYINYEIERIKKNE